MKVFSYFTNIYNIFPVPLPSVRKILETACSRKKIKYIPQNALWLNRLFTELANRDNRLCLTIDCSEINKDGPGRFLSEADNPEFQICCFNSANNELVYNEFVSKRINSAEDSENFHFKIIKLKSKTTKNLTLDAADELRNGADNTVTRSIYITVLCVNEKENNKMRKLKSMKKRENTRK